MKTPPAPTAPCVEKLAASEKVLVFSDAHLEVGESAREQRAEFVAFLRQFNPPNATRIIILGDLFDFWFEYRHVVFSGYFDVLRALADLRDQGVKLHLVCGNHDFWAGRFLKDHLGFHVHPRPVCMQFGERRVLLLHGDGLNPRDWGYRIYKRIARAKPVIGLFGLLHPDWAMFIAQRVSRGSRRLTKVVDPAKGKEAAALRAYAQQALERGDADVVMCGHAHAPARQEFPTPTGPGLYLNTGDWMYHRSYIQWDGAEFYLHTAPGTA